MTWPWALWEQAVAAGVPTAALLLAAAVLLWPRPLGPGTAMGHVTSAGRSASRGRGVLTPSVGATGGSPRGTEVAVAAELLALALQTGAGVATALEVVAGEGDDATARALRTLAAGRRWGLSPQTVEQLVEGRWRPLSAALRLADDAGVPPARPLRRAAADDRARLRHAVDVATARLRVRLVLPLGLCLLPAFVLTTVVPVVIALAARLAAP